MIGSPVKSILKFPKSTIGETERKPLASKNLTIGIGVDFLATTLSILRISRRGQNLDKLSALTVFLILEESNEGMDFIAKEVRELISLAMPMYERQSGRLGRTLISRIVSSRPK